MSSQQAFERSGAKLTPANWMELADIYLKEKQEYLSSDAYFNLDDPRKPIDPTRNVSPAIYVNATPDEIFSYFKTLISVNEVSASLLNIWKISDEREESNYTIMKDYDPIDLRITSKFIGWWLDNHTSYPYFLHDALARRIKLITDEAAVRFLRGGKIENSYALMREEMRLMGFDLV